MLAWQNRISVLIGKFFVLRDGEIVIHHDTFEEAYRTCVEQFEDGRFLIQELFPDDYNKFVFASA